MKNLMWKTLLALWISSTAVAIAAEEKFKCGEYEFTGVLRKVEGKNVLKLYENSLSEVTLTLAPDLEDLASIHINNSVKLRGKMYMPIKTYQGHVESLLTPEQIKDLTAPNKPSVARYMRDDIKPRVADPLHPDLDSGMKLIKALPCRKNDKTRR